MMCRALLLLLLCVGTSFADGNRLSYLNGPVDPYYVHRDFARLTTPQWAGEQGVDAVVVLAIDDMRDTKSYEAYLRPILDRLKEIDGRAPVSIMTNQVPADDPHLQTWLDEGLTIEVHTADHPCPLLHGGDFKKAKSTYDRCVDALAAIKGNDPVAYRMPCCDSMNTPSPRFWAEIFDKVTPEGRFLYVDSSVFNITTKEDRVLTKETTLDASGQPRFRKYLPFPSFVNTIEDYPYPYVIGDTCWEFPCVVPSDWEGQNLHRPNNPQTVVDLKFALDATVKKQGVYNLVFHPHGWMRNDQVVDLIDYSVEKYGDRVKFLTFREAHDRLRRHLMNGNALRDPSGEKSGVRMLDVNGDGFMDLLIPEADGMLTTRVWSPNSSRWEEFQQPLSLEGVSFGVVHGPNASFARATGDLIELFTFSGDEWSSESFPQPQLAEQKTASQAGDPSPRVQLFDLDGNGTCEILLQDSGQQVILSRQETGAWEKLPYQLPQRIQLTDAARQAWRWIDLNGDQGADIVYSSPNEYAVYHFDAEQGWVETLAYDRRAPDAGPQPIPAFIRADGSNNGVWVHSEHLWWQNEDTDRLPAKVDRVPFKSIQQKP